jgi:hypothetical protein
MISGLRLLARDEEDLSVFSAHLQDAVIRVGEIAYMPRQRRFAVLVHRYCWGDCGEDAAPGARMLAGLHFDGVLAVKAHRVRQDDPEAVVQLLAIHFTAEGEMGGAIDLMLAGGGRLRLTVECIEAVLRDLEGPWPARARPEHELDFEPREPPARDLAKS